MKDNFWVWWNTGRRWINYKSPADFCDYVPHDPVTGNATFDNTSGAGRQHVAAIAYRGEFRGRSGLHVWDETTYLGVIDEG